MKPTFRLLGITLLFLLVTNISTASASVLLPSTETSVPGLDSTSIKTALNEFKSLSKKERKERVKEAKRAFKKYRKENRTNPDQPDSVVLIILAILLPPLAVYLHQGETNSKFWLSVLLTLLFWIPGIIYALLVISDKA